MRTVWRFHILAWLGVLAISGGSRGVEPGPVQRLPAVQVSYENEENEKEKEEPSLEERFDELDKKLDEQQEAVDEIKDDLKGVVYPGHSKATMKVVGRIHMDYWTFPQTDEGINLIETGDPNISPQDELGFRRLRFGVRGDLPSNMTYCIEMEFAGGNNAEFRDAYLGWEDLPIFQEVRIGNQKRPYGLDQWNSSRYNVFLERPFIIEAFNQDVRRFGIQSWSHSEDLRYNWQYGVFNQRLIQDEGVYISDHLQLQVAGRFASTWWYDETSDGRGYGHWAISGTAADTDGLAGGDPDPLGAGRAQNEARFRTRAEARSAQRWLDTERIDGADWYELLGLEGVLNIGPLQLVGEYQNVWLQRDPRFGGDLFFHGAYGYVSYFLTGEHMPWDRETGQLERPVPFENFFLVDRCHGGIGRGMGAWQVALRAEYGDLSDGNILGGIGQSVTVGLNWYWTPYARLQFNYLAGRIEDHRLDADRPGSPIISGDYHIIGTRAMVDF